METSSNIFLSFLGSYSGLIGTAFQVVIYSVILFTFMMGLWHIIRAASHLKKHTAAELKAEARTPSHRGDDLSIVTAKALYSAWSEHRQAGEPKPMTFLQEATRQLSEELFEGTYLRRISMCANLLPPMGFIGTVFGMIFIFLAKADPASQLNTYGLAVALFTTLVALILFVALEGGRFLLFIIAQGRINAGLEFVAETAAKSTAQGKAAGETSEIQT